MFSPDDRHVSAFCSQFYRRCSCVVFFFRYFCVMSTFLYHISALDTVVWKLQPHGVTEQFSCVHSNRFRSYLTTIIAMAIPNTLTLTNLHTNFHELYSQLFPTILFFKKLETVSFLDVEKVLKWKVTYCGVNSFEALTGIISYFSPYVAMYVFHCFLKRRKM